MGSCSASTWHDQRTSLLCRQTSATGVRMRVRERVVAVRATCGRVCVYARLIVFQGSALGTLCTTRARRPSLPPSVTWTIEGWV